MAEEAGLKPCTRESLVQAVERSMSGRTLSSVHAFLTDLGGVEGQHPSVQCYAVYIRDGGFMVVFPANEDIRSAVQAMDRKDAVEEPAFYEGEVRSESMKGKAGDLIPVFLVDFPWAMVGYFAFSTGLKSNLLKQVVFPFGSGEQKVRPARVSTFNLADEWISQGGMDEDTAQDYLTGEDAEEELEQAKLALGRQRPLTRPIAPDSQADDPEELKARVLELEQQLKDAQRTKPQGPSGFVGATAQAPPLFQNSAARGEIRAEDWARLQQLAGPAPTKMVRAEAQRPRGQPTSEEFQLQLFADLEKEAVEAADGPVAHLVPDESIQDPVQQMMMMQLRQNQQLLEKLCAPKHRDPVLGALSGGASGSESASGSGVKGCLARDAFLVAVQDVEKVASMAMANAARELGMSRDRIDGSLMRTYVEKKIPLAESRLLANLATMLAESWAIGYEAKNIALMGVVSRMLFFVEQSAIDGGRMQMGYLLGGFPEPAMHLLSQRRRSSLSPFAKLCNPAWLSANLAYLKDLDYIEARTQQLGKIDPKGKGQEEQEEKVPKPKPRVKPPKGGKKGGGKDADGQTTNMAED